MFWAETEPKSILSPTTDFARQSNILSISESEGLENKIEFFFDFLKEFLNPLFAFIMTGKGAHGSLDRVVRFPWHAAKMSLWLG
jgi:hypothetical protein